MEPNKSSLRRALREKRQSLPDAAERSVRIAHHALGSEEWRSAETVMIYLSLPEEVDTAPLLTAALEQGKMLCVPRIGDDGVMVAVRVSSLDPSAMEEYRSGILQPPADSGATIQPDRINLLLIPCVGVDRTGGRLGFGGGHFDRFLTRTVGIKMGVVFECQVCDSLPREEHDQPLSAWVTEEGVARLS